MAQFKDRPGDVSMRENKEIERDNRSEFDRRDKKESIFNAQNEHEKYRTYQGMSTSRDYEIIVHSYNNSKIGHFNIEFRSYGKRDSWLGANISENNTFTIQGIKGGIYNETDNSIKRIEKEPQNHKATILKVSEQEYNKALNYAKNKFLEKYQDYDILGEAEHCVSFADKVLKNISGYGEKGKTLGDMALGQSIAARLARSSYSNGHLVSNSNHRESIDKETNTSLVENSKYNENTVLLDAQRNITINTNGILDAKKYGNLKGRDIYISDNVGNQHYQIYFDKNQNDIIYDNNGNDKLTLNIIDHSKLWFSKDGINLKITNLENNGSVTIIDWFKQRWRGGFKRRYENILTNRIEQISTTSGKSIYSSQVDKLVQAMSTFTPPINGQIHLSSQQQADLNNIIAIHWG